MVLLIKVMAGKRDIKNDFKRVHDLTVRFYIANVNIRVRIPLDSPTVLASKHCGDAGVL